MALNSAVTDFKWSPNFSSGRPAGEPTFIVIHHWGDDGQTHQNVVNYLTRYGGDTSAHYVVSAGRVTQLVHDYDRAWHAGPSGNPRGIGIECRPEMSAGDFAEVAKLVAAIRGEWGNLPLKKHSDFMNTSCPGRWGSQLARLSALADGDTTSTMSTSATTHTSQPASYAQLEVDGVWGMATTMALQKSFGTPVDGVVSSQSTANKGRLAAAGYGWEFVSPSNAVGSILIKAIQESVGADPDGQFGKDSITRSQEKAGTTPDGFLSAPSLFVMKVQENLNNKGKMF